MLSFATQTIYLLDGKEVSEEVYHQTIEQLSWEGTN
jgi:hypothetical protein